MEKRFPFKELEPEIYKLWEEGGYFEPDFSKKEKFSIVMPPPNANASLHVGHALTIALEDLMVRFNRMKGKSVLWVPGFDHAGFETQVVYEKKQAEIDNNNQPVNDKQKIYQNIWNFTQKNRELCRQQIKRLGASCDWSKEKFTLDNDVVEIIYQTFEKLYQDGLVYQGERIINWCPKHQTSLSDLEVKYKEIKGSLWYIKYKLKNKNLKSKTDYIIVATTRPETMLGDTAVAVNPKDKRYKNLVGQIVIVPIINREIPIIADQLVDQNFGTGAVKVTPAHDPIDFEIGKKHNLKFIQVIDKKQKMTEMAGREFFGLNLKETREKIIEELKNLGLLEKIEDYTHQVPLCYKCQAQIEPLISKQWFINIKPLAKEAIKAVKSKKIKFISKRFEKTFFYWMNDIRDWNISRQIIWGIRIPVFYCKDLANKNCQEKNGIIISEKKPEKCPFCGSKNLIEETDVFDTWFSSSQWPFAVLGWPNSQEYKKFYPISVMETGRDIIFFWVARMIMLSLYVTKKVPFNYIYLHGLILSKEGEKMSKSKGNVIDPIEMAEKYGADSLRMALLFGASSERDVVFSEQKVLAQQKFITKIWNASRFILQNMPPNFDFKKTKNSFVLTKDDKWILNKLNKTAKAVTKDIENFNFHLATEKLYQFFWHDFCDKTIEYEKKRLLTAATEKEKQTAFFVLYIVLLNSLKLLHPFIPFITEAIYQKLPQKDKKYLINEDWPKN